MIQHFPFDSIAHSLLITYLSNRRSIPPPSSSSFSQVVFIDAKPTVRKQILRELQILHECNSKYIVSFYGAYLNEPHICMCMEYMDKSWVSKRAGAWEISDEQVLVMEISKVKVKSKIIDFLNPH